MEVFDKVLLERVRASEYFEEYSTAFETATGLPLELTASNQVKFALCSRSHGNNQFCLLMSEKGFNCEACRLLNIEVWEQIGKEVEYNAVQPCPIPLTRKSPETIHGIVAGRWDGPKTFECFAGMCETMVPVKTSVGVVGFLKTGQVLLKEPTREAFQLAFEKIGELRGGVDAKAIEDAYFETPIVPSQQYEAMLVLLNSFAAQISRQVEQLIREQPDAHDVPLIVKKAKAFIHEHYEDAITLDRVARAISVSAAHLSREFKSATGTGYLEYLNQHRVERSKALLTRKELRISEVAYQVGFQSLAPFNRAFKMFTGVTPKEYRKL